MAALTSLADGSLLVQGDLPAGYDEIRAWGGNVVPRDESKAIPSAGSTMLTVLALPVLGVLHLLEYVAGPMGAVGALAAAAVGGGVWAWWRNARLAAATASGLFLGAAIMQVALQPASSPYLEAAAIQVVNLLFHAFASALLYDLLRTRVSQPALATALYAFGTPALFWGLNLKYHAIAISLTMVVIWLYQEGHRTGPLRTGLAFLCAGLAVWNHIPNGLLVVASLGLMALPAVMLGIKPLLWRAGAGIAGLAVGVVPEAIDRMIHNSLEVRDRFIQVGGGADVPGQVAKQAERGRLQWTVWNDPSGPWEATKQLWFWPDRATPHIGDAMPMLALVPLLVLAVWAYRGHGKHVGRPLLAYALVHLGVVLALFGEGVFRNGAGFDNRQASTLWPFAAIVLAAVLQHVQVSLRAVAKSGAAIVAAMLVLVWIPFAIARHQKGYSALINGPVYDLVMPLQVIGLVVAAALLILWLLPRTRPWRGHAVAAAIAWSFMLQGLLQLGPARSTQPGVSFPFVAWPMALLEWGVHWLIYPL